MKKGFPLGRFIEGILVVVLLLLLYPAFFWTFRIPIAVNSGGYEQRDFIVTEVYTRREYTRRVYRKRGGWDVKKTIYGYLEGLKENEVLTNPIGETLALGDRVPVFYNPSYDDNFVRIFGVGFDLRIIHWKRMANRWFYFWYFVILYWPLLAIYLVLTIRRQTLVYYLIYEWKGV